MGYLVGLRCHNDLQAAYDAYYSAVPVAFVPLSGGASKQIEYTKYDSGGGTGWTRYTLNYDSGGQYVDSTLSPATAWTTIPTCDPAEQFLDGVTVGWGIASALIVVSCLTMMKRAMR